MDLLNKLRNRVNDSDFVLTMYSNHNGKNLWNCICSAIDWIQVGVASVRKEHIFTNDRFLDCMNFYKYISSIDVTCDGIYQLHRVFMGNNILPFENDCSIFNHHILNTKSDDEFFKELRACFGAHPVNLNNRKNKEEKRFASWSIIGPSFNEYDCNVILYSSNPEEKDIYLGVNVSDLKLYFEKRYNYIEKIIKKVDELESASFI